MIEHIESDGKSNMIERKPYLNQTANQCKYKSGSQNQIKRQAAEFSDAFRNVEKIS
jgi:hypothetical protein